MKYLFSLLCLVLLYCSSSDHAENSEEIIQFLSIESGIQDTVFLDEIFFADEYDPVFQSNDDINVEYIRKTNQIVFNPDSGFAGLSFIRFQNSGVSRVIPVKVKKKTAVRFQYEPVQPVTEMYVMGNFNNWNRRGNRMLDEDGDGVYETFVYLDDGIYEYQFVLDRREIFDPENPEKVDNGFGYFNSVKRVRSETRQKAPRIFWVNGGSANSAAFAVENVTRQKNSEFHILVDNELIPADKILQKRNDYYEIMLNRLPESRKIQRLRLVAASDNAPGNVLSLWLKDGNILPASEKPLWQDAVIYSLMIDRFKNGNPENDKPVDHPELADQANFNGGDFAGITETIQSGYFDSLGINTVWISPVNKTTDTAYQEWPEPHRYFSGYHGYWPVSSNKTEPRFGSMRELKNLVKKAHHKDMKILMDFISNHVHREHPYFTLHRGWFGQVDLANGEKNIRRWDEYRLTTWFDTFLPSFDYLGSQEALQAMTDNAVWWLDETGVDGFRHDATKHVPYEFWRTLTRKIKSRKNHTNNGNIYQVGETFGGDDLIKSYVNNGMLDGQFNFNQFFVARRVFTEKEGSFEDLALAIEKSLEVYGYNHLMGNIMDSHDQVRMMALLEGDLTLSDNGTERAWVKPGIEVNDPVTYKKQLVFMTYLLTVPGIPIIYYGDEFGMTGANDPDNRRMMRFGDELSDIEVKHLNSVRQLLAIRNNYSSLRRGDLKTLQYDDDILIYSRGDNNERLVIALNKGTDDRKIRINLPEWILNEQAKSLITEEIFKINQNKLDVLVKNYSAEIFILL